MLSNQKLQNSLNEIKEISHMDTALFTAKGKLVAHTEEMPLPEALEQQVVVDFAESLAEKQTYQDYHLYKVMVEGETAVSYTHLDVYKRQDCDFDADTAKKLYQAICEDAADQKLQKYNLTNALKDPEETGEYSSASISMDFYHVSADWKNVYDRLDDYYTNMGESVETSRSYGGSAYVSFGKDCTNIINTLIECGVIDDVSEIHFLSSGEKTSQG